MLGVEHHLLDRGQVRSFVAGYASSAPVTPGRKYRRIDRWRAACSPNWDRRLTCLMNIQAARLGGLDSRLADQKSGIKR
jgi:hypothetical protein